MDVGRQGLLRRRRAARTQTAATTDEARLSASGHRFTAAVRYSGTVAVVAVGGDLDPATAPLLIASVDAIVGLGQRHVVVDVNDVTFIDGAGLSALESLAERPTVTLTRFSPPVRRLVTEFGRTSALHDATAPVAGPAESHDAAAG